MATQGFHGDLMEVLAGELNCGVCLELFDSPLLLPCGHNFCRSCIINIVDSGMSFSALALGPPKSFNCPVCQASINLKKYDVQSLPVNRALESIIYLCKAKSSSDVYDRSWTSDFTVQIGSCQLHSNPLDKFCESCNVTVCRKCIKEKHESQKVRHRIIAVQESATEWQVQIADNLVSVKAKSTQLNSHIAQLEDILEQVDKTADQVKKELEKHVSTLMTSLRQQQDKLKRQLESDMMEIRKPVDCELRKCKIAKTSIQESMKKLSAIRKVKDSNLCIKLMKDMSKQLEMLGMEVGWCLERQAMPTVAMPTWDLDTQHILAAVHSLSWRQGTLEGKDIGVQTDEEILNIHKTEPSRNNSHEVMMNTENGTDNPQKKTTPEINLEGKAVNEEIKQTAVRDGDGQRNLVEVRQLGDAERVNGIEPGLKNNSESLVAEKVINQSKSDSSLLVSRMQRTANALSSAGREKLPNDPVSNGNPTDANKEVELIGADSNNNARDCNRSLSYVKIGGQNLLSSFDGQRNIGRRSYPLDIYGRSQSYEEEAKVKEDVGTVIDADAKSHERSSPSSHAVAVAKFVARRRTVSPAKGSPVRRAVGSDLGGSLISGLALSSSSNESVCECNELGSANQRREDGQVKVELANTSEVKYKIERKDGDMGKLNDSGASVDWEAEFMKKGSSWVAKKGQAVRTASNKIRSDTSDVGRASGEIRRVDETNERPDATNQSVEASSKLVDKGNNYCDNFTTARAGAIEKSRRDSKESRNPEIRGRGVKSTGSTIVKRSVVAGEAHGATAMQDGVQKSSSSIPIADKGQMSRPFSQKKSFQKTPVSVNLDFNLRGKSSPPEKIMEARNTDV